MNFVERWIKFRDFSKATRNGQDAEQKAINFMLSNDNIEDLFKTEEGRHKFYEPGLFWGVSFSDLSKLDLTNVDLNKFYRIPFSTETKWPKNLPEGFNPNKLIEEGKRFKGMGIEELHEQGITGKGVKVAYIDTGIDVVHEEFAGQDIEYVDLSHGEVGHHGYAAAARLVGKNLGVAKDASLIYYGACPSGKNKQDFLKKKALASIEALEDVTKRVTNGDKIAVVGMSSGIEYIISLMDDEKEKEVLLTRCKNARESLKELGIPLVDVYTMSDVKLSYVHKEDPKKDSNDQNNYAVTDKVFFTDEWVFLIEAGKCVPVPFTTNGYKYENTVGSQSWTVPQIVGLFCLAKQVNPDISMEDWVTALKSTATANNAGLKIVNAPRMIKQIKMLKEENKHCIKK